MILIFNLSADAEKLVADLRADGKRAALRNPNAFSDAPSEFEGAEKVFCDDAKIAEVYKARGVSVAPFKKKTTKTKSKRKAKAD